MRAVLTNQARPRISLSQSGLSHGASTSVRRTTVPPLRRRLTVGDAFTILLSPVLTTAFVVDITCKDRRRQEWEQKIANIQQELENIRDRETRSWATIQLRSIQAGLQCQRRSYSTATQTSPTRNVDAIRNQGRRLMVEHVPLTSPEDVPAERRKALQRYENLLATKLGFQLLLYITTGRDPTVKMTMEGLSEATLVPDNMDVLLKQLRHINQSLFELTQQLSDFPSQLSPDTQERHDLDKQILNLTWQCRKGDISISELIYGYTQTVMQSQTGPSVTAYQYLVSTFSTLHTDALTSIAMFPYLKTRQILNDMHVMNIIQQYGNVKDPRRLELFLRQLALPEKGFQTATPWKLTTIDGVQVSVPLDRRPRTFDVLIRSTLQGDQPHKARAYAKLLLQQTVSDRRAASLFNSFLTYCARHGNWAYGQLWVHRAISWAALLTNRSTILLQRIVFRMLDLCISCEQTEQYEIILNAAVVAGIGVPPVDEDRPDSFSDLARDIRGQWLSRIEANHAKSQASRESIQIAIAFQTEMAKVNSAIRDFVGVTDITRLRSLMTRGELLRPDYASALNTARTDAGSSNHFQPWSEIDHLGFSDDLFASAPTSTTSDFEKPSVKQKFLELQEAYGTLVERYDEQVASNNEIRKIVNTYLPVESSHGLKHNLHKALQGIAGTEGQNDTLRERNLLLQTEAEAVKAQNAHLTIQLKESNEKQSELVKTAAKTQAELKGVNRKSLESIFVEKENFNLRSQVRTLTNRHLAAQNEKEGLRKELIALRARHAKVEQEMAALRTQYENIEEGPAFGAS